MSPASPAPLSGWYVISLRPPGQHAPIRRAAAALGAGCFALASLRLEALPAAATLAQALACDRVIATSPAAARFAAEAAAGLRQRRGQRWFALGPGTAAALRRGGVAHVRTPARGHDSEALLALPALQDVRNTTIGLLTAPGGRDLLAMQLQRRGATVVRADLYRRRARPPTAARKRALLQLPPRRSALLVSSAEAFAVLWESCTPAERQRLRRFHAVASSARLRTLLHGLGFPTPGLAAGAQPRAMLAAVREHAAAGFR